jgi:NifU-like domain
MSHVDPAAIGAEIESVIEKMSALGNAQTAAQAQELVRLLMALYGAGLARMLAIVATERGGPQAALNRLGTDPLLGSLLVLHNLHPHAIDTRLDRALAKLRPHLPPHTDVTVVAVDRGSVHLRVEAAGSERPRSAGAIRLAIERAIHEAAPEIATVHIEGLDHQFLHLVRPSSGQRPLDRKTRAAP